MFYIFRKKTNEFSHETQGQPNPKKKGEYLVPPFSTSVKPPVIPEGKQAVFTLDKWILVDDNRSKEYWLKSDASKIVLALGMALDLTTMTHLEPPLGDYEFITDQWVKTQAALLAEWKTNRASAVANIEIIHNEVTYQGDELSQTRMARAILGLPDDETLMPWISKNNLSHQLTKVDLTAILNLAGNAQSIIWNEGRPS